MLTPLIVGALALAATVASPQPQRSSVAMFPTVLGPDSAPSLSLLISEVAASVAWRPTLRLLSPDDLAAETSDNRSSRFFECGADPKCWAGSLSPLHVDLCLLVVINGTVDPPILSVRAIEVASGELAGQATGPIEGALQSVVRARIDEVLQSAGHLAAGRLTIGQGAEVTDVDIRPYPLAQRSPLTFDLWPGSYRVTAASRDGRRLDVQVEVRSEEEIRIDFPQLTEETSVLESPLLWIAVGISVAAAAVGVFVATRPPESQCLCIGNCPEC